MATTAETNPDSPRFTLEIKKDAATDQDLYTISSDEVSPTNDLGLVLPNIFPPGFQVRYSQLAKPMPLFGSLAGYRPGYFVATTIRDCAVASQTVSRPLSMDECNAISWYASKSLSISSYGAPLGGIAATTRWWSTRSTMKFPFFKPDGQSINFDKFLGLRGIRAGLMWQQTRLFAYLLVGIPVGKILISSYAASVLVVGNLNDSRLKDFWQEMKQQRQDGTVGQKKQRIPVPQPGEQTQFDSYSLHTPQPENQAAASGWSDSGDAAASPQSEYSPQYSSPVSPRWDDASPQQSPAFDFDDASPVSQENRQTPSNPQSASGSGSAWERIRKGQSSPSRASQPPPQTRSSNDPSEDAWARARRTGSSSGEEDRRPASTGDQLADYTGTDAERRRARDQAQKEFDARLDRERRGESFDGGDDRKWR